MPELPEVQTVADELIEAGLIGAEIERAEVFWPRTVAPHSPEDFCARLAGQRIATIGRRAKYIVIAFGGGGYLLIHLRMTGRLLFSSPAVERDKHEHVVLLLRDGRQLRFSDTRKFGRWNLHDTLDAFNARLGPEPLEADFTPQVLRAILQKHKRQLKPLLLDQSVIAGLGNIYVDEALWEARLHPCRNAGDVSEREARALHKAIPLVLQRGLRNMGTSLGNSSTNFYSVAGRGRNKDELKVFRRTGLPCPRCQSTIERLVVGQRSTHICPGCQQL